MKCPNCGADLPIISGGLVTNEKFLIYLVWTFKNGIWILRAICTQAERAKSYVKALKAQSKILGLNYAVFVENTYANHLFAWTAQRVEEEAR